jgi:hypothetical protein
MQKINVNEMPEQERHSPKGKFGAAYKEISIALGRDKNSLDLDKRHPFDLMLARIPAGKSFCPYHAEGAQWELYLVVSGRGIVRDATGTTRYLPVTRSSSSQAKRISFPPRLTRSLSTT